MYTAMLTVDNIVSGARHDIWTVNVDEEYQEEKAVGGGSSIGSTGRDAPLLPRRVPAVTSRTSR